MINQWEKRTDRLADIPQPTNPQIIEKDYSVTYHNIHHWAWESILPIIRDMDRFTDGAKIYIPNYPGYPKDFIKRLLSKQEVIIKEVNQTPLHNSLNPDYSLYIPYLNSLETDKPSEPDKLAKKLMLFIKKKDIPYNSVMINVRLHNRRWLPLSRIQELVNWLSSYKCYIFINPEMEKLAYKGKPLTKEDNVTDKHVLTDEPFKTMELPEIKNAIIIKNATWEERLGYAKGCCFVFNLGMGANDTFGLLAGKPSISIASCNELRSQSLLGYKKTNQIHIGVNKPRFDITYHLYDDITEVTVADVMKEFCAIQLNKPKRPYIFVSSRNLIQWPHYQKCSGGVRAVNKMASVLSDRGYEAYVVDTHQNNEFIQGIIKRNAIVVYHEAVYENYLNVPDYVIWQLGWWEQGGNKPRTLKSNIRFHWSDRFLTDDIKNSSKLHHKLTVDIIEHELFNTENTGKRDINLMYMGKGEGSIMRTLPLENKIEITWEWPETRAEVAYLMKHAKYLWITDAISSIEDEARCCGCPVIFIPNHNYSKDDLKRLQRSLDGMSTGISAEEIKEAENSLKYYTGKREEYYKERLPEIDNFIEVTQCM